MALRAIWQFMDRDVTHKILYEPKRSWGSYTILWVTDRSINCHSIKVMVNCYCCTLIFKCPISHGTMKHVSVILFWWFGSYTICTIQVQVLLLRYGPEVPWTICYIILNACKSVRRHVFVIVYLRQKTNSDKIRKKTLYWSGPIHILKYSLGNRSSIVFSGKV
jgi:hypothetical protein